MMASSLWTTADSESANDILLYPVAVSASASCATARHGRPVHLEPKIRWTHEMRDLPVRLAYDAKTAPFGVEAGDSRLRKLAAFRDLLLGSASVCEVVGPQVFRVTQNLAE